MRQIDEAPEGLEGIEWMTAEDAAAKWDRSVRAVQRYCRQNYEAIGAYKNAGRWTIPVLACPPLKEEDLSEFLEEVLRYQTLGMGVFPVDDIQAKWCLKAVEVRGYGVSRNAGEALTCDNLVLTDPKGWDLAFGRTEKIDLKGLVIALIPCAFDLLKAWAEMGA